MDEGGHGRLVRKDLHRAVHGVGVRLRRHGRTAADQPPLRQGIFIQGLRHLPQLAGGHLVHQADLGGVAVDLLELLVHDVEDGPPQAEGGDDQRRAAADADDRHPESPLVAEEIPDGDLVVEGQPPPEEGQPLQQHPLARRGRLGPHQLGGDGGQGGEAGPKGGERHRADGSKACHSGGHRLQPVLDGAQGVDDVPGVADDPGQQRQPNRQAQQGPHGAGQKAVAHVFDGDDPLGVAQGLQPADGDPLLLHHAGHGGEAHQRRHQEKDEGEHRCQVAHPVGVHGVADIAGVGVPAQEVPLAFLDVLDIPPGLFQLLPGVGDLVLGLRSAVLVLGEAVGVRRLAVVQLRPGIRQLCLGISCFLSQGLPGVLQLLQAVVVVLPAVVQLRPAVGELLLAVLELLIGILQLPPGILQFCPAVRKFLFCLVQDGLGVIQLPLGGPQLGHAVVVLVPAVVQFPPGGQQGLIGGDHRSAVGGDLGHLRLQIG